MAKTIQEAVPGLSPFDQLAQERSNRVQINRLMRLASAHPYGWSLPAEKVQPIMDAILDGSWQGVPAIKEIVGPGYDPFYWAQMKTREMVIRRGHERINEANGILAHQLTRAARAECDDSCEPE